MAPHPRYDEPFFWWGPGWDDRPAPRIEALLRDGTLDSWYGAVLWAAMSRRISLVIVSEPSGAGKTTLLTALLDFLPPRTRRIYLRGSFETFSFLTDPAVEPQAAVLLVNEISPHLPVYLWGDAVDRVLEATGRGYMILATAHARGAQDFVGMLTGSPLRIAAPKIASFALVVVMESPAVPGRGGRVASIWPLTATREGLAIEPFSPDSEHNISPKQKAPDGASYPTWVDPSDLLWRRRILDDVREGRLARIPHMLPESETAGEPYSATTP